MSKGNLKGWRGIGPNAGQYITADSGFLYICDRVGITQFDHAAPDSTEFKEMLVEWYFSGNWLEVYEDGR